MSAKNGQDELTLEIAVLSAESLKNPSFFSGRLRPYVTLSTTHTPTPTLYRTRIDEKGVCNPTWHDTIRLPVNPTFLLREHGSPSVHVSVLSKGILLGPTELGWCRVTPSDVVDDLRPPGMNRRLSYALRSGRHGGRGHGVIHLAVRLVGPALNRMAPPPVVSRPLEQGLGRVAIGIPVAEWALAGGGLKDRHVRLWGGF